jgi:hypothetical protein
MSYMLYKELEENKEDIKRNPNNFSTFLGYSIIICIILMSIMLYGPKSAFLGF